MHKCYTASVIRVNEEGSTNVPALLRSCFVGLFDFRVFTIQQKKMELAVCFFAER